MKSIAFFDLEINPQNHQICDVGSVKSDGTSFHENSIPRLLEFIRNEDFICGHNVFKHDLQYIQQITGNKIFGLQNTIDTLFLSPLLFPSYPYHRLLKDDKLNKEEQSNPLNDAKKAMDLFYDEAAAFDNLAESIKTIYYNLLHGQKEFACFFSYLNYASPLSTQDLESLIWFSFENKICQGANLSKFIASNSVALAYCLSLVFISDRYSITPPWVLHTFPDVDRLMFLLRNNPCVTGCSYCDEALDPVKALERYFGHSSFRSYDGKPLQEHAVRAAVNNKSLLAVFPTGGGKSITFQVPALMSGDNAKALTVVISPLQSLMKDQVDNLEKNGIISAVTINGMLDPVERQNAIERVEGTKKDTAVANILYISPESLRSITIEKLLLGRKIARFVIDEAHCFSSWGQDFRVDYLYIGEFIKTLQEKKGLTDKIPVSCFTATAKQKVIEDIRTYFKEKLDLDLEVYRASASRTNLHYKVFPKENEEDKYAEVRRLLEEKQCPTIIYVSRTRKAAQLAKQLCDDGFNARAYHGKMETEEKVQNQNDFILGEVDIIVATSAFGMGVDKDNVGMVIHFQISDSLESYVQEAGRAGRKESITGDCYILFNEEDLDKHFLLLNQTKLDCKEINQIWKAIKELDRKRGQVKSSALEIARKAGWDDSVRDIETRVTTAIAALEDAGYIKRGQNMPQVFANSILSKTAQEAIDKINGSPKFIEKDKEKAARIIKALFASKSKRLATDESAESRIDYIADRLALQREDVSRIVTLLRDENILAKTKDMTAFVKRNESINRSLTIVEKFRSLEEFFLREIDEGEHTYNLKELNEKAAAEGCMDVTPNKINIILNFWSIKNWIKKHTLPLTKNHIKIGLSQEKSELRDKMCKRHFLARFIVEHLFKKVNNLQDIKEQGDEVLIEFSVLELKEAAQNDEGLFTGMVSIEDIEDTLFYLSRIDAIKIEGGFLVIYNRLVINRLETNNQIQYKKSDYEKLDQFYQSKVHQIHIVGEYAKKMIDNYNEALQFVDDYFRLNYNSFLNKYFPGTDRQKEIKRTMTPAKFQQIFGELSLEQHEIVLDKDNKLIVVAAGPGSGKTRVLVHKLASLLLMEDVKHEQLLMLTFSRAAATEFKKRLLHLIGNAANFVGIKTFHSYCFDLVGKVGNLEKSDSILQIAFEKIKNRDVERSSITKSVLVVDEAQDMNVHEYELVKALMDQNEDMRVILVGDDDQNIYGFRGADSKFMQQIIIEGNAKKYTLNKNYRSKANIVSIANQWASQIKGRLKELPIIADDENDGNIHIVRYGETNFIAPLVESIKSTDLAGSTCVLTRTNDEAVQISGMLIRDGYSAKLIQTNDGFSLYNLQELRFFTDCLNGNTNSPIIVDEDWNNGKRELVKKFQSSNKLDWCKVIIKDFEIANPVKRYKTDWKTYLVESKFEDFIQINGETIYVSTIHKAKGREFDNVFILLDDFDAHAEDCKRQLYVAMTRAKSSLTIHYNGKYLQGLIANKLTSTFDSYIYQTPNYLCCNLSHKDVQLRYFSFIQRRLESVQAGATLICKEEGLAINNGDFILKFSNKFKEAINHYEGRGYKIDSAKINFNVFWKNPENEQEVQIVLPEIHFKKIEHSPVSK